MYYLGSCFYPNGKKNSVVFSPDGSHHNPLSLLRVRRLKTPKHSHFIHIPPAHQINLWSSSAKDRCGCIGELCVEKCLDPVSFSWFLSLFDEDFDGTWMQVCLAQAVPSPPQPTASTLPMSRCTLSPPPPPVGNWTCLVLMITWKYIFTFQHKTSWACWSPLNWLPRADQPHLCRGFRLYQPPSQEALRKTKKIERPETYNLNYAVVSTSALVRSKSEKVRRGKVGWVMVERTLKASHLRSNQWGRGFFYLKWTLNEEETCSLDQDPEVKLNWESPGCLPTTSSS